MTAERSAPYVDQEQDTDWSGYLSVIVPIYNEEAHVEKLLQAVHASPVPKQVIIVDDGSTDGTRKKLKGTNLSDKCVMVSHDRNYGKGSAIRTGLQHAKGEFVLIQDSDLEYNPSDYPALVQPLQNGLANVVYGVRNDRPQRGLFYFGSRLITLLTNWIYGLNLHDEATCYKAFRRSVLEKVRLECRRFEFCPEVTAKMARMGERIYEVPISYHPRSSRQGKKIRVWDGAVAIWTLIRFRLVGLATILSDREAVSPTQGTLLMGRSPRCSGLGLPRSIT